MKYENIVTLKNGKKCLIRNAGRYDAQGVLDVFLKTHEETDYLSSYRDEATFDVAFEETFLADKEENEKEVYLCAVVDGKIVGTAGVDAVGLNEKMRHRATYGIAVCKDYWRLGIGKALTSASIECAKVAGYAQLELEVVSDNNGAVSLYKRMGFTEYGCNPKGFKSRYNGWQGLVAMKMDLE